MPINAANALRVLVIQQENREVKDRLKRHGIKLTGMPISELHRLADEHLHANAARLLAELQNHPLIVHYREEWQRVKSTDPGERANLLSDAQNRRT